MRAPLSLVAGLLSCSTVRLEPREAPDAVPSAADADGLWVLQIRRQTWKPRDLEFVLQLETADDRASGVATVDPVFIGRTAASLQSFEADGDGVEFSLLSKGDDIVYRFSGRRDGGTMDGLVRWDDGKREQVEPFSAYRREVRRFDFDFDSDRFPVERDPRAVGVEPVLLDRLILGAETARSDSLLVLAEGRLVAARTFGGADAATAVGSLATAITTLAHGQGDVPDGLRIRPSEVVAVGQALLDGGEWTGEPALPDHWIGILAALASDAAAPGPGASWTTQPDPTDPEGAPLGFGHVTDAGEGLLVYPDARLVVVRTLRRTENRYDHRYDDRAEMEWLDEMAESIAVEKLGRAIRRP